jgi:UDP-N-acetyl-2-amino-2-deoxyglucuronate dehydrogenase
MAKTSLAVIGLGMAVTPHAKSLLDLADRVEVAAAYSPTEARRAEFARNFGFPVSGDLDPLLADKTVDAVVILTPPNTHLELVGRSAKAGKHVLLEKPLEISLERAEALVSTAEQAGVTLGIVLQHRFRPVAEALAEIIREGRLGEIVNVNVQVRNWRPQGYYDQPGRGTKARDGGGVLLTQAIHTLDLAVALTGLPAEVSAYAATSPIHRMETEDIVAGAWRYANGAMGTVSATTCAYPGLRDAIEIIGTEGTATLKGTALAVRFRNGEFFEARDDSEGSGRGADPMAFSHQHHRALIEDFLDAIETGREPRISGREALKVHDLIEALLASAKAGAPQAVRRRT